MVGQHVPQAIAGQQQQLVLIVPPQDGHLSAAAAQTVRNEVFAESTTGVRSK